MPGKQVCNRRRRNVEHLRNLYSTTVTSRFVTPVLKIGKQFLRLWMHECNLAPFSTLRNSEKNNLTMYHVANLDVTLGVKDPAFLFAPLSN